MKILSLLLYLFYTSLTLHCQELDFERFTAGISIKYLLPKGDMGDYWNKVPGIGMMLGYSVQNSLTLEGEILYSKFDPQISGNKFPEIQFIEFSGGVKYIFRLSEKVHMNLKSGIENSMFIFSGQAAESVYQENRNESEFGFFVLSGLQYDIGKGIKIELSLKILSILSSPETINMLIPGVTFYIL